MNRGERPNVVVTVFRRSVSSLPVAAASNRQDQLPSARPGTFILASLPSPRTSCNGTTTVSASYDLVSLGLSFAPGPNGLIRLQFYEVNSDDLPGTDGVWNSGRIVITTVPEPSTNAALAVGLVGLFATTRRKFAAPRAHNSA